MPQPNVFSADCPSREIMARIAEKWSMLIIISLKNGTLRFGELKRCINGVSQKMLTQTLRNLESDNIVKRVEFKEKPMRVEYSLTPLGENLVSLIDNLKLWIEDNYFELIKQSEPHQNPVP